MQATNPENGKTMFFCDKCLPFGSSISCSHFQCFLNALKHILEYILGQKDVIVNYLDDFLFIGVSVKDCNKMVRSFIKLCKQLGVPIAEEKTEWGSMKMISLGILIDGENQVLSIPEDK